MLFKRNLPLLPYLRAYKVFPEPAPVPACFRQGSSYLCAYKAPNKTLFWSFYVSFCTFYASLRLKRTVFTQLLNKVISMALWTKAITCDKAGFKSRFCQEHQAGKNIISVNPVILSNFSSCFCAFSWLKNPFNQCNPWSINDLRLFKVLYNCRETFTDVMSALQIKLFMQNKAKQSQIQKG